MRTEADTRATLIDPKLKAAAWIDIQVTRESITTSGITAIPTGE